MTQCNLCGGTMPDAYIIKGAVESLHLFSYTYQSCASGHSQLLMPRRHCSCGSAPIDWSCRSYFPAIVPQRWKSFASAMAINCPSDGILLPSLMHNRHNDAFASPELSSHGFRVAVMLCFNLLVSAKSLMSVNYLPQCR